MKFSFLIRILPGSLPRKGNLSEKYTKTPIMVSTMPVIIRKPPIFFIFTYFVFLTALVSTAEQSESLTCLML